MNAIHALYVRGFRLVLILHLAIFRMRWTVLEFRVIMTVIFAFTLILVVVRVLAEAGPVLCETEVVDPKVRCTCGSGTHSVVEAIRSVPFHVVPLDCVSARQHRCHKSCLFVLYSSIVRDSIVVRAVGDADSAKLEADGLVLLHDGGARQVQRNSVERAVLDDVVSIFALRDVGGDDTAPHGANHLVVVDSQVVRGGTDGSEGADRTVVNRLVVSDGDVVGRRQISVDDDGPVLIASEKVVRDLGVRKALVRVNTVSRRRPSEVVGKRAVLADLRQGGSVAVHVDPERIVLDDVVTDVVAGEDTGAKMATPS